MPAGMSPSLSAVTPPNFKDVAYASAHSKQKLDIYLPKGAGPFPAVFYYHAGGFRFGSKDSVGQGWGKAFLDAGYAIVAVGYRLSTDALFPAAPQDAKAAVRFVRANAGQYNLDPARFAAFGASAGGNLAALVGTSGNTKSVLDNPAYGNAGVSSAVSAVIDWFGPNDFLAIDGMLRAQGCDASKIDHNTAKGFESLYLGAALPQVPQKVKQANPITYVDSKDPPFLLQNGDADCNVGSGQGELLRSALSKAGVPVTLDLFAKTGHGGAAFETAANIQKMIAFLDQRLK